MKIIKDNKFLKPKHKALIKEMFTDSFPLFWRTDQLYPDNRPYLTHSFILYDPVKDTSTINSPKYEEVLDILKTFCFRNKIPFTKCFRANFNRTFPLKTQKGTFHSDHTFDHTQLLVYLNDADGDTILENGTRIKFKKDLGVCFGNLLHYGETPSHKYPQGRGILIFTFI
tara:strand:- start:762 stop:1271 length:510 start_codon:yes stop_codon:yes gene_type:complete